MKIVYLSITGQTRKFVNKLPYESLEINETNAFDRISEDFVLVVPTYEIEVTELAWDFMNVNSRMCKGVAGGGNRNFADLYGFTAKDISREFRVPLLMLFEFQGSDNDVNKIIEEIDNIGKTKIQQKTKRGFLFQIK